MSALVPTILVCSISLIQTNGAVTKPVTSGDFKDNSANSASRLYSYNPVGLYASASPFGAYSFYTPTYVSGPQTTSSQIVPVKEENVIIRNSNGYLRDSYGNKFIESPQSVAYKSILPQQFVQLQDLPAHLSQPLLAATSYQLKHQPQQYYFAPPHFKAVQTVPSLVHFTRPQQSHVYGGNIKNFAPSTSHNAHGFSHTTLQRQATPSTPQQQSSSNKAVYTNSQNGGQNSSEQKFQRLKEDSQKRQGPRSFPFTVNKEPSDNGPVRQTFTTTVNGKKTIINIDTKPPLPLLDISLLEPLTFSNPVVPQIQHFLPRIPSATYHKLPDLNVEAKKHDDEFIISNTRSYDSGSVQESSDENSAENNETPLTDNDDQDERSKPEHDTGTAKSPKFDTTYNEKVISYTKKIENKPVSHSYSKNSQQAPVNYSYSKQTNDKPIHYSSLHSSNKPVQTKEINYDSEDRSPKHLTYEFKNKKLQNQRPPAHNVPISNSENKEPYYSQKSEEERSNQSRYHPHYNEQHRQKKLYTQHLRPEHRQELQQNPEDQKGLFPPIQYIKPQTIRAPIRVHVQHVTPPEYEENIHLIPRTHSAVKIDPNQHMKQKPQAPSNTKTYSSNGYRKKDSSPHFHGTAKRIIIKNESPDEKHLHQEQMMKEEMNHEDNSEEDFEKAYKNAAYGFPAFEKETEDEKEFDPESYGVPQYHSEYNIEDNPFKRYQAENDDYPKLMRVSYKDENDKTKEDYYLDYSINKPESLVDQYQKKIDYYKMFRNHEKDKYSPSDDEQHHKSSEYILAPSYEFDFEPKQMAKKTEKLKEDPRFYEYNFSKESPYDSSAHSTHANLRSKSKTQFVEPQFQYGFEPVPLPRLLDSELAAVASNNHHRNDTPDYKKKTYKESLFIKRTNTSSGKPS